MGLTPIDPSEWCKASISASQLSAKLALLTANHTGVMQATAESAEAQQLLLAAIEQQHDTTTACQASKQFVGNCALTTAALCVPEDLCLLQHRDEHYELVAGCVTAPSYWRLGDKLGKSLWDVHDTVPGLNHALGERMQNFFDRLPANRCLSRRNWFFHASNELFQPHPERRRPVLTAAAAEQLWVRSETQTLRRLSEQVIVFTIAVECHALRDIAAYPAAAQTLLTALASRNEQERQAASQASYEQGVYRFLEHCC